MCYFVKQCWGMGYVSLFALSFIIELKKVHIPYNLKILIQNVKCLNYLENNVMYLVMLLVKNGKVQVK